jgi:hypothetical protein
MSFRARAWEMGRVVEIQNSKLKIQNPAYDLLVAASEEIRLSPPADPFDDDVLSKLRDRLEKCADVAFAHLVDVAVPNRGVDPGPTLFVWLVPAAMKSLRAALNLVSEAVADALPGDRFLDVVILNSAPELLPEIERIGCLFVEMDSSERQRALEAAIE